MYCTCCFTFRVVYNLHGDSKSTGIYLVTNWCLCSQYSWWSSYIKDIHKKIIGLLFPDLDKPTKICSTKNILLLVEFWNNFLLFSECLYYKNILVFFCFFFLKSLKKKKLIAYLYIYLPTYNILCIPIS